MNHSIKAKNFRAIRANDLRQTPAGKLLVRCGFEPYDTESSAWRVAEQAAAEIEILAAALQKIERWHGEFPHSGRLEKGGMEMSYGAAFGSCGERDFMRGVAREALRQIRS